MYEGQKGTVTLDDNTGRRLGTFWKQQCGEGIDGSDMSIAHHPHLWTHPSGKRRYCRGWFPKVSVKRGGIEYKRVKTW